MDQEKKGSKKQGGGRKDWGRSLLTGQNVSALGSQRGTKTRKIPWETGRVAITERGSTLPKPSGTGTKGFGVALGNKKRPCKRARAGRVLTPEQGMLSGKGLGSEGSPGTSWASQGRDRIMKIKKARLTREKNWFIGDGSAVELE